MLLYSLLVTLLRGVRLGVSPFHGAPLARPCRVKREMLPRRGET
jgi:hypothetical protein